MKRIHFFLVMGIIFTLTSCIEIVDDISINKDGSGKLKYTVNLSSSKVKIASLLALDSLDGKKIPSRAEIEEKMNQFVHEFEQKSGISNVNSSRDFNNYVFKIWCDFASVSELQKAIKSTVQTEVRGENEFLDEKVDWLALNGSSFERSIPEFTIKKAKSLNDEEKGLLKEGNYISITRFEQPVTKFTNPAAVMAKNKLAVMLKTNVYSLSQNPKLLENTIYLSPLKE